MTKKFLKGLYCVALMFVTLGALCFIPAIKSNAKVASADEVSSQVAETSGTSGVWVDTYAAAATAPTYATETRPDGEFKVIDSEEKLAYVAFMVTIQGNSDWAKMNFELADDLDLSASLWTPIGTSANPYQGIFHGNRHTISGLRVSESSAAQASVAGLFGYTKGDGASYAMITDLSLSSFTYVTGGNATLKAGTLVGNAGKNTIIANVYDEREYKGDIATIGSVADSTVYVYRGGSPDGKTAKYTTKEKIKSTVTVDKMSAALPTSGYAITYVQTSKSGTTGFSADNTGFYKCTSTTTYDETLKYPIYGTVVTETGANGVAYGNYGTLLDTRANAMAAGEGYFAVNKNKTLNKGYTFTLSTPSISSSTMTTLYNRGLIETMTWEEKSYSVKVNYGYGHNLNGTPAGQRTMDLTVGNDFSWEEAIPTSRYTNDPIDSLFTTYRRMGYEYAGRFCESTFENEFVGYVGDNTGYRGGSYSMYLKWTPKTDIAYSVDFANASSDTGFNPKDAVRKFDIKENGVSVLSTDDIAAADRVDFDFTNHAADKAVTIEFVLNAGYKFPTSGSSNEITASREDVDACGAYLLFAENGYDKYNETAYSISTETRTTGEAGANETWIIVTVENIVAGDGAITIAFEREVYTIELEGEGVTYALSEVTNAKDETTDTYTVLSGKTVQTRWGENFKLTATAEDNKYIIAYAAQDFPINAGTITGDGTYDDNYTKNFKTYTYTISSYANLLTAGKTSHKITITAIELKVNVDISIVHNAEDAYKAIAENTAAGRKDASGSETLTTGDSPVTFIANIVDGLVEVYMYSNAYYTNDNGAFVVKRLIGDNYTEIQSLQPEAEFVTAGDYKGYYKYAYRFEGIIEDNKGVPSYEVQFTAVPQTYNVEYAVEVSFDGGATYVTLNASDADHAKLISRWFGTDGYPTAKPSGKYGDSVNFAFVLTDAFGKVELLQQDYVISRKDAETTVGAVGTLNNDETAYIFGTTDSVVIARFILKNPELTLLGEGYVLSVNGQNRKVAYTDAGIKFADGESVKFTTTGITRTATVDAAGNVPMDVNSNVVTIDIPTGYYFVGWYLKNGEVYTELTSGADVSLNQLLTNTVIVNALKSSTTAVTNFEIVPAIKQKTVTLKFSKGKNALEDYVTSGATSAGEYTYYHEQENARYNQFTGDNTNARAAFEFSTMNNKVHKVGSSQKGWTGEYESAVHEFLIDGTFTSQLFDTNVWATATNFDIEFTPTWNLLQYTIKIDNSVEVNIYMGDTVTVTPGQIGTETEGAATYTVTRPNGDILSSASIAPQQGMHVTGFTFGGGTVTRTDEVTTFTLTEANIKTYLETGFFYTAGQAFTIETKKDPNIYRIVLTSNRSGETFLSGFESDENTKYVEVTYGTQPTALAGINVERAGYRLSAWVDTANTSNVLASVDAAGRYTYTGNYLTNSNTTVKAMWTPVEGGEYIQIATTGNKTTDYIGIAQQVATATVSTLGSDANLTQTLPNGDIITDQYWAKAQKEDGAYVKVSTSDTLSLTTVAESGNYVYVVEFRDTFETNVSYTIESTPVVVTINRNGLVIDGWTLASYYTGDSSYIAVEGANEYGTIQFKNGLTDGNRAEALAALNAKVARNKVVIQDATRKFNAGSYTTARYYITLTEEEYANLDTTVVRRDAEGFYIELTAEASSNKIQIKPTPVTIVVSGKGFFMGENINHSVKAEFVAGLEIAPIDNFQFNATVMTNSGAAGVYDKTAQFTWADLKITRAGETVANGNFEFTIDDQYEIEEITTTNAYVYNYSVGYLTADANNALAGVADLYQGENPDYRVRVTDIKVGNTSVATFNSNATFFNYVDEATGNAIFTISGNGTTKFMLAIRQGSDVEFTVTVEEITAGTKLIFLGFQTVKADAAAYAEAFGDTPVAEKSDTVTTLATTNVYALYTDLKQVTVNYNANASMTSETLYLTADAAKNIADPVWKGFAFKRWTTTNEQLGIIDASTGTKVTANAGAYTKATITADWELEEPTITTNKTTITGNAIDTTITTGSITIAISDIISNITNKNETD
ncbi:MAG: hypothetical protein NC218_12075, partial [Acetobacter sp.]|nr:hypothetical protein [Acetobacter sp.]